ncbi:MAG: DUF4097 domain-containing protein, partial [Gammaproteobacteria bacterium]|nr:DUF4097 domain-containing protein [Gammaproteobacteria bacterium]
DLANSNTLSIDAVAGDLDVIGVSGSDQAVITGKACASKEAWLDESRVNTSSGNHAVIEVDLPNVDKGWSFTGNSYVRLDLRVEVPDHLALEIKDSSGDMFLKNIAAVKVSDSSGSIEIVAARGPISISDSSGNIDVDEVEGDLTIESDSSGDINANDIHGSVLVVKDSSGDIDVSDVSDNVVVEKDSSGDIRATHVGGDFRVLKDGSGSISSNDVTGEVQIPKKS